ncbi:TPA_asm: HNH endonuclease [Caudoviricetes sp. vir524]|jgi:hypothetical protein|nr:TPA_asm: HNH endonuclease [Caudoviricetes sp. vir524]
MRKKITISKKTCSKCGRVCAPHSLEIHHIDGNHQNDDLNNLEVLCTLCHREFHYKRRESPITNTDPAHEPFPVTRHEIAAYEEFMGLPGLGRKFIDAGLWIIKDADGPKVSA